MIAQLLPQLPPVDITHGIEQWSRKPDIGSSIIIGDTILQPIYRVFLLFSTSANVHKIVISQ